MQVEVKEWPWVLRFHHVNPYPFSLPPTPLSCCLIKLLEVGISQGALSFPWPVSSPQPSCCSHTDPLSGMAFPTLICSESSRCPHSPTGQTAWLYLRLSPSFQLLHPRDEARLACPLSTLLSGDMSAKSKSQYRAEWTGNRSRNRGGWSRDSPLGGWSPSASPHCWHTYQVSSEGHGTVLWK